MPKTCDHPGCTFARFSHGYCGMHQNDRTDQKWLDTIAKRQNKAIIARQSIKKVSSAKQKENTKESARDKAFYLICDLQLPHKCAYCGDPLPRQLEPINCDHIFEKAIFPHLRYVIEDIAPTCLKCHTPKTAHRYTETMQEFELQKSKIGNHC